MTRTICPARLCLSCHIKLDAVQTAPIPEPATLALMTPGLVGLVARRWRQNQLLGRSGIESAT